MHRAADNLHRDVKKKKLLRHTEDRFDHSASLQDEAQLDFPSSDPPSSQPETNVLPPNFQAKADAHPPSSPVESDADPPNTQAEADTDPPSSQTETDSDPTSSQVEAPPSSPMRCATTEEDEINVEDGRLHYHSRMLTFKSKCLFMSDTVKLRATI